MWRSGSSRRLEAMAAVQPVRVARDELEAPQALKIRMRHDGFDQPLAEPAAAVRFEHVHVAEIRVRRAIGHDAREADLIAAIEQPEAQRVGDRLGHRLLRNPLGPERSAQKRMDRVEVELLSDRS